MTKAKPASGRPLLMRIDTSGSTSECYALQEHADTLIGRGATADVKVPSDFMDVSNEHAEIRHLDGDNYVLIHRGTNPTRIIRHDEPLSPSSHLELKNPGAHEILKFNDVIILAGRLKFKFISRSCDVETQESISSSTSILVVLNADGVRYSELVSNNREVTRNTIEDCFEIFKRDCKSYSGKFPERVGDGVQVVFSSATEAVSYAKEVQHKLMLYNRCLPAAQQMQFRIGCDLGEIECKEWAPPGEVTCGEAVNRAQRIQRRAKPGGILISGLVYEALARSARSEFKRAGTLEFCRQIVELYQWITFDFAPEEYPLPPGDSPRQAVR